MVDFNVHWDVVKGMSWARAQGHGGITRFLERIGVARSSAYRWEQGVRRLLEFGASDLRRLRAERDKLYAELEGLCAGGQRFGPMSREQERRFILTMAVLGNSDTEIATLLAAVGGRWLSHETIAATIREAGALARAAFARHFSGVGTVAAVDEIFLGQAPLLLAVEPLSLLISGLRLAPGRSGEDWKPVFLEMGELLRALADGGKGIAKAASEAGVSLQADLFHLLRPGWNWLASYEKTCARKARAEQEAEGAYQKALGDAKKNKSKKKERACASARQRRDDARKAHDEALGEWCRIGDLLETVRGAFDRVKPDGKLNTASHARRVVTEALAAMRQTTEGQRLASKLGGVLRAPAFAFLVTLEAGLNHLGLEQLGPNPQPKLGRLVAETVAWRDAHKEAVEWLEGASTGSLADEVELEVIRVVDQAARSSSYVECVNSRIRLVQVARKHLSEDFIYLLAVYHNMKPFGRGTVRASSTPAKLAGIELPTNDWIELLDLTASDAQAGLRGEELAQAAAEAA